MSFFIAEGNLEASTFPPFAQIEKGYGYVLNFFRAQSLSPESIEPQLGLLGTILGEGSLTRKQKEYIAVVVSGNNMSTYCVTRHCAALQSMNVTDPELDQLGVDHREYAGLTPAESTLLDFALKLTLHPERVEQSDIAGLRTAGWTDPQILEAVQVTAAMNFANRISIGLGVRPETPPRAFPPRG